VLLNDHVAEVYANAELDALIRRDTRIALSHFPLDLCPAADGIRHARKFRQKAVAGVLNDPAPVLLDLRIDQLPKMGFEPLVRPLLIRSHQTRVPCHIGGKDCGEAADRRHFSPGVTCLNQLYLETRMSPSARMPADAGLCDGLAVPQSGQCMPLVSRASSF
jgi:hypothetical protein